MLILEGFFIIIISFIIANLEIQIEGKDGWAKNLPTWRINNKLTKLILGRNPFTGFHLWAFLALVTFMHFPFFVGLAWTISTELKILAMMFLITALEDFLWFVLNPAYGIKKFNSKDVSWHKWLGPIPTLYIFLICGAILLTLINYFFL